MYMNHSEVWCMASLVTLKLSTKTALVGFWQESLERYSSDSIAFQRSVIEMFDQRKTKKETQEWSFQKSAQFHLGVDRLMIECITYSVPFPIDTHHYSKHSVS